MPNGTPGLTQLLQPIAGAESAARQAATAPIRQLGGDVPTVPGPAEATIAALSGQSLRIGGLAPPTGLGLPALPGIQAPALPAVPGAGGAIRTSAEQTAPSRTFRGGLEGV